MADLPLHFRILVFDFNENINVAIFRRISASL